MNRKILVFMVFILILNVISPIFHSSNVTAASDISSTNVTSLTVSPSQINDGGNAKVRVEFDDKAKKIQSGDTIKVNWPNAGELKIDGYSKTIDLTVRGEVVGQAVITGAGATITFNQNVDKLSDVSGFAEFEVQGRNLTNTTNSDTKTGTITSGNKSANISVTKGEAGTNSVFYYKTGDMQTDDTNHVRWFLNINNEKSTLTKTLL
ncbi:Ig-like domain-containing protein [Staphylococcus agnetis]|uniref:Ig-like domain-containing protein n=1 Tax=Staphylococcus agnetis TaxID=985762 RepID=UPI0023AA7243|nr:Ig-like domain-containing protein [Staphylococcus agnetis]